MMNNFLFYLSYLFKCFCVKAVTKLGHRQMLFFQVSHTHHAHERPPHTDAHRHTQNELLAVSVYKIHSRGRARAEDTLPKCHALEL